MATNREFPHGAQYVASPTWAGLVSQLRVGSYPMVTFALFILPLGSVRAALPVRLRERRNRKCALYFNTGRGWFPQRAPKHFTVAIGR